MKNRVIIVGPYPPDFGGVSSHIQLMVKKFILEIEVEEVHVISPRSTNVYGEVPMKEKLKVIKTIDWKFLLNFYLIDFKNINLHLSVILDFGLKRYLYFLLQSIAIQLSISQENGVRNSILLYQSNLCLGALFIKEKNKKSADLILTVFGEYNDAREDFGKMVTKKVFDIPRKIISSSNYCASLYDSICNRPIDTNYFGIDLAALSANRKLRKGDSKFAVLFVGRLSKQMGLDVFLEFAQRMSAVDVSCSFTVAGAAGDMTAEVQDIKKILGKRFRLEVNFDSKMLPTLLSESSLLVVPTIATHACMGMAIKEGFAAGLPVLASDSGGIPEAIVPGVNGFLYDCRLAKEEIVEYLIEKTSLLKNDPGLCLRIGMDNRARAEELFDENVTFERYRKLMM